MTTLTQKALLNKIQSRKKDSKGFTLIELLIVVVILGVLSAVALPNFLNQSDKAKVSAANTAAKAAAMACATALIASEEDDYTTPDGITLALPATLPDGNESVEADGCVDGQTFSYSESVGTPATAIVTGTAVEFVQKAAIEEPV